MADRASVSIAIGWVLPANRRDAFFETIRCEGLSTKWDGPDFDATQVPFGAPLALYAHEVARGRLGCSGGALHRL
ncbi:hypothetical protein [Sphingomonas sp. UYP23]